VVPRMMMAPIVSAPVAKVPIPRLPPSTTSLALSPGTKRRRTKKLGADTSNDGAPAYTTGTAIASTEVRPRMLPDRRGVVSQSSSSVASSTVAALAELPQVDVTQN